MRQAFTMIELIFVIVILGILAAVALPKLSATRTDASVSKLVSNIMTGVSEISSYAMSRSNIDSNLSKMSNAISSLEDSNEATLSNNQAVIKAGSVNNCVKISITSNNGTDTLNVTFGNAGGDDVCQAVQRAIDASQYPMKLRGTSVVY